MITIVQDIFHRRELLWLLVKRNLHIRYKSSILGFLWTMLNPIFMIVLYGIFMKLLKVYNPDNATFLPMFVVGIIVWQFLAMCMGDSLFSILGNANLVTKVSFPRSILPLSMVTANFINFLLSCTILLAFLIIFKNANPGTMDFNYGHLFYLPFIIASQFALCVGVSLIVSCSNVFFRDTEHIMTMVMLAWFFLTPIFYDINAIPEQIAGLDVQRLSFLNPMTGIVTAYRHVLMSTDIIAPKLVVMSHLVCWLILIFGFAFFNRVQKRFADAL